MQARFLLGPAGSGKTFRCLSEIRAELLNAPEGPDLLLLAPKQATFQLERQLLNDGSVQGFTRLRILSFERLAAWVFEKLEQPMPELLSEEGRVMVLRALLEQRHGDLRVFRASARLAGFSRQLSGLLREFQRRQMSADTVTRLAARPGLPPALADKLHDIALLLRLLEEWIGAPSDGPRIEDAPRLLDVATAALRHHPGPLDVGGLWLDGFAEMTPQEQSLLAAVLPHCARATLAFCLPGAPREEEPWLSPWALVSQTAIACHQAANAADDVEVSMELLAPGSGEHRFSHNPTLAAVERVMAGDAPDRSGTPAGAAGAQTVLRLIECANVEAEATLAAREILRFVRDGARFRDCAILVRQLEGYQDALRRVLSRYGVPFFLDRREAVSHHPLAELTRFALRTVAFDWQRDDWMGALKSGLAGLRDDEVDRLENAALSRGWQGSGTWLQPLKDPENSLDLERLEPLRCRAVAAFVTLREALAQAGWTPSGPALAAALRELWTALEVEAQLETWASGDAPGLAAMHRTVWDQMGDWLDNLERAFRSVSLSLGDWLQVIEAGLSGLTVGVVPPALDQVLVGSVDRSRNPDLRLALVLGANESVFPAPPTRLPLLTEADTEALEGLGVALAAGRRRYGHERYLGYIAFTRARERLIVSWSGADARGRAANPSRFVDELRKAFPELSVERFNGHVEPREAQHAIELAPALSVDILTTDNPLAGLAEVREWLERVRRVAAALAATALQPETARALYGEPLMLSVSALESFAACPFQFFVSRGLRAEERDEFDVDRRRTGEFQHAVLQGFHRRLIESGRRWRELDADEAVRWVQEIGEAELQAHRHGLFAADRGREFLARSLLRNLSLLVATLTRWARTNDFEPAAIEVAFGPRDPWPAWRLDWEGGGTVLIRGRVDRVDLCRLPGGRARVAILDYKSGGKEFKALRFAHGLELQMPAYLCAITRSDEARRTLGAESLVPAGVFYVGLRSKTPSSKTRDEALEQGQAGPETAFQHRGRFDVEALRSLDTSDEGSGQFKCQFKKDGSLKKSGHDALPHAGFEALLADTEQQIRELARRILGGEAAVSPYKLNASDTACGWCRFRSICRFDPWTQPFRVLKAAGAAATPGESDE